MSKARWLIIHPFQLRLQRGIEVYLWNLAAALFQEDVELHILSWAGRLEIPDYANENNLYLHRVPAVRYRQAYFAIPFYVARLVIGNYDHVLVHFAGYGEGPAFLFNPFVSKTLVFSCVSFST